MLGFLVVVVRSSQASDGGVFGRGFGSSLRFLDLVELVMVGVFGWGFVSNLRFGGILWSHPS